MSTIEIIKHKFELLSPAMNKKARRLWAACEAHAIGPGGEDIVAIATGISKAYIRIGLQELEQSKQVTLLFKPKRRLKARRIRQPGGGRKFVEVKDPSILTAIENILENDIAGDPMSEKKWVRCSTNKLSDQLKELGYLVSPNTVFRILKDMGYSMRANNKRKIRDNNPARDQQFKYIALQRKKFSDACLPIISVDAKKKELIGNFFNKGKTWCKQAEKVNQNDYPSEAECRAVPYGIYDVTKNTGCVFVGISNNTPEFAVDAI